MFDKLKEKKINELMFINKVEQLVTELVEDKANYHYMGWDYVEDPGWSFNEEAPQFHKTLTRVPYNVKDAVMHEDDDETYKTYIETRLTMDLRFYTADKVFHHEDDKPFEYRYSDDGDSYNSYKIDGWSRGDIMIADINFTICEEDVDKYGMGDVNEDKMTQFKVIISLGEFYDIDVYITNEYNYSNHKDFFVEVCDLDLSDEDMGRILNDPNLPRSELVRWFSSVLHSIDKVFGTKYENKDNIYRWAHNADEF